MKSIFDVIMIIFISMTMFVSMLFFSEEILIKQQAVQIRNRLINLVEIESGYTDKVEEQLNEDLKDFSKEYIINVSKTGKLEQFEKLEIEVVIKHNRKLPFNSERKVDHISRGVYYNVNP